MSQPAPATDKTIAPAPAAPPAQSGTHGPSAKPRRRWLRRLTILLAAMVLLGIFHAPLLGGVAGFLVVEDELEPADAVLILGGEGRYDEAARLVRERWVHRVMVIQERPNRLEALGVVPSEGDRARRELTARGVPADALDVLADSGFRLWNRARRLRDWMADNPHARLIVLHDRLDGRHTRMVVESVLGPGASARLRWRGLADAEFDVSNWWRYRKGVPRMLTHYVGLVYQGLFGEDADWRIWNPDEYARTLPRPTE